MLGLQGKDLVVCLIRMLTSLDVVFICDSSLFLDFSDLFLHLDDGILGKKDLLTHNVDLRFHILVPPDSVIKVNFLVG